MNQMMEHTDLRRVLEQRSPFLLVDRMLEISSKRAVGIKNVTASEPFLSGHFPDDPILPGVLLIEAMSQVGGVLLACGGHATTGRRGLLAGVDKVKFKIPVRPGDQVMIEARLVAALGDVARVRAQGSVDGVEVCRAEISYGFIDRNADSSRHEE